MAQTGSIKLLGLLNVNQLLSVMDVAYPRISDSSIEGDSLVVTASGKNDRIFLLQHIARRMAEKCIGLLRRVPIAVI